MYRPTLKAIEVTSMGIRASVPNFWDPRTDNNIGAPLLSSLKLWHVKWTVYKNCNDFLKLPELNILQTSSIIDAQWRMKWTGERRCRWRHPDFQKSVFYDLFVVMNVHPSDHTEFWFTLFKTVKWRVLCHQNLVRTEPLFKNSNFSLLESDLWTKSKKQQSYHENYGPIRR